MPTRPAAASVVRVASAALAMIVAAGVIWLVVRPTDERGPQRAAQAARARQVEPATTLSPRPFCEKATRGFEPRTIAVSGVTGGTSIVTPSRDVNGVPGVPPLTSAGKSLFAWDREQGIRPGDPAGNVLLNAHTWPSRAPSASTWSRSPVSPLRRRLPPHDREAA